MYQNVNCVLWILTCPYLAATDRQQNRDNEVLIAMTSAVFSAIQFWRTFLISDIQALERQSDWMSEIKNVG